MKSRLNVVKSDGSVEKYLHTKVIAVINNAFSRVGNSDIYVAQQLAEVVTYHLYQTKQGKVSSSEIRSVIKAALCETGYDSAAIALVDSHHERQLRRSRIEVINAKINSVADAVRFADPNDGFVKSRWNKSLIIEDLVGKHKIDRTIARAIAGEVEQKILDMRSSPLTSSLVKQIMFNETALMLRAHGQLETEKTTTRKVEAVLA